MLNFIAGFAVGALFTGLITLGILWYIRANLNESDNQDFWDMYD